MKYRAIIMHFPRKLNNHQQNILVANFKVFVKGLMRNIEKYELKLGRMEKIGGGIMQRFAPTTLTSIAFLKHHLVQLRVNTHLYIRLETPDDQTYWFIYAQENLAVLNQHIAGLRMKAGQLIAEGKIEKALKNEVIPNMGFDPSRVKFEYKNIERGDERETGNDEAGKKQSP